MILTAKCDICGIESEDISLNHDYCGADLCAECGIKSDLQNLRDERKKQKEWLDSTFSKELADMDKGIKELEKKLAKIEAKRETNENLHCR